MANNIVKRDKLIVAIAIIVFGILLCFFGRELLQILLTAVGAYFIVRGILDIIAKFILLGTMEIVGGVVFIVFSWTLLIVAMLILGLLLIVLGIKLLIERGNKNPLAIVLAVLAIVVGILLALCQIIGVDWLFVTLGVIVIAFGSSMLIGVKH